jgi:hypothetical protein
MAGGTTFINVLTREGNVYVTGKNTAGFGVGNSITVSIQVTFLLIFFKTENKFYSIPVTRTYGADFYDSFHVSIMVSMDASYSIDSSGRLWGW